MQFRSTYSRGKTIVMGYDLSSICNIHKKNFSVFSNSMPSNKETERSCIPAPQGMLLFRISLSILPQRDGHHTWKEKCRRNNLLCFIHLYNIFPVVPSHLHDKRKSWVVESLWQYIGQIRILSIRQYIVNMHYEHLSSVIIGAKQW